MLAFWLRGSGLRIREPSHQPLDWALVYALSTVVAAAATATAAPAPPLQLAPPPRLPGSAQAPAVLLQLHRLQAVAPRAQRRQTRLRLRRRC